jgi:hypothetical protein
MMIFDRGQREGEQNKLLAVAKEPGAWSTKPQHHWREERAKVH